MIVNNAHLSRVSWNAGNEITVEPDAFLIRLEVNFDIKGRITSTVIYDAVLVEARGDEITISAVEEGCFTMHYVSASADETNDPIDTGDFL